MTEFERMAVNQAAELIVGAGGNREVVTWRIEHGYLPGFGVEREAVMEVGDNATGDIPSEVLWSGAWLDVAKALARQIADAPEDIAAFARLDQEDFSTHRGKFMPVPSAWPCFDYPYYLVVRKLDNVFVARVMRRLYERFVPQPISEPKRKSKKKETTP